MVLFDVNPRFPAAAEFTGLHIHDGSATGNGPVTINTGLSGGNSVKTDTGFTNIYRFVNVGGGAALATLADMVMNPESHYVNLHTTVNPGGVVRSQLAAANLAKPAVSAIISAVSDPTRTTGALGGLVTIFGSNLLKVPGNVGASGNSVAAPASYNGTTVTIGGKNAPLALVDPSFLVVQVPADLTPGPQSVIVTNSNGAGSSANLNVAAVAPAAFFNADGGIFLKNRDYSLVTSANPAQAGDVLLLYSTGLGLTTPRLQTGVITPDPHVSNTFYPTATATVSVGGQNALVTYSLASPGFVGLYQTAFTVPSGAGTGKVPVTLTIGGVTSNTVLLAVR
jgi:uncharacterized protein (TIGR03437 family)